MQRVRPIKISGGCDPGDGQGSAWGVAEVCGGISKQIAPRIVRLSWACAWVGRRTVASRKVAVEECVQMDSAWLTRERAFDPGGYLEGVMAWRGGWDQRVLASVGYQVCLEQKLIYLEYATARTEQRRYPVQLVTTALPWPGKRWWFRCPILNGDGACGRRVSKLYLPPGQICFGCRACHNLTYQSCRDSHRYDRL